MYKSSILSGSWLPAATLLSICGSYVLISRYLKRVEGDKDENRPQVSKTGLLKLLPLEQTSLILNIPSISTITFFRGVADIPIITKRVASILNANPWLKGRLVRKSGKLYCRYPTDVTWHGDTPESLGDSFSLIKDPVIHSDTPYSALSKCVSKLTIKNGQNCVGRDECLFKV